MSTLSLRKIKHDSASVDNITLNSSGHVTTAERLIVNGATTNTNSNWGYYINPKSGGGVGDFTVTRPDGNVSWLSIDGSGRVTMPYQPCCSAYHSGDIAYNGSLSPIAFNSARFNVGNHFNTSTGTFTAPVAGKYLVTAYVHWMGDSAYTYQFLRIQVASTNTGIELMRQGAKSGYDVFGGTHIVSVSANDTIRVVMGNSGIDAGYSRGGSDFNTFEVYLLG